MLEEKLIELKNENLALHQQLALYGSDLSASVAQLTRSMRDLEAAHLAALSRLTRAAAFKDGDTSEHITRIGVLSAHLARAMGCAADWCTLLELAAPMHDVGKIGVPDAILKKPGKLTDDEWHIMRQHPRFGADILGGSDIPLFELAAEVALYHHEKFDGSGYPHGLAGSAIPLSARIVALVDYFDALTMDRCYRKAFEDAEAYKMIRENSGSHFDPEIVSVFFAVAGELVDLRTQVNNGVLVMAA